MRSKIRRYINISKWFFEKEYMNHKLLVLDERNVAIAVDTFRSFYMSNMPILCLSINMSIVYLFMTAQKNILLDTSLSFLYPIHPQRNIELLCAKKLQYNFFVHHRTSPSRHFKIPVRFLKTVPSFACVLWNRMLVLIKRMYTEKNVFMTNAVAEVTATGRGVH